MTTLALKEQRINIYMDINYINQLKELVKEKKIPSMSKFCQEAVQEKLQALEKPSSCLKQPMILNLLHAAKKSKMISQPLILKDR